jgi:AraC-like DNA-binding protein
MSGFAEDRNRRLLRARDTIDRSYAEPLDVAALARVAHVSPAHFARQFRLVFGETPHRYLQRRRIERAMELLRDTDRPVTEVCLDVGFAGLGTFSRTFGAVVGESPSAYRSRTAADRDPRREYVPACIAKALRRPIGATAQESSRGEAGRVAAL